MKALKIASLFLLLQWGMASCYKEAGLKPTEEPETIYGDPTLPQGNHDYDDGIVELYQKYGTLFLYKYEPKDLYYNIREWVGAEYDEETGTLIRGGYYDVPADEDYVGFQIALLKDIWIKYYPDEFLKKYLPRRVFLADSFHQLNILYGSPGAGWESYIYDSFLSHAGGDYILATWGRAGVENISESERYAFQGSINATFLRSVVDRGGISPIKAFTDLTDYTKVNWYNYLEYGFVEYDWTITENQYTDLKSYLRVIVSTSYDVLTAPGGVLNADTDVNGLIRKKYDILVNHFKTKYNVDLQAIGNAKNP